MGVASASAFNALTVGLALQSGFGAVPGVEGLSQSGTGLQVRDHNSLSKIPEQFRDPLPIMKQEQFTQAEKQVQTLKDVHGRASTDPRFARKVLEAVKERRKLDVVGPTPVCLQDGFPPTSVTGTVITDAAGGSTVNIDYSFSAVNNCPDPIDTIQFTAAEIYTCPAGCDQTSGVKDVFANGIPGSIGQNIMSKATAFDQFYCKQTDSNGVVTPEAPTSLTITVQAEGTKAGGGVQSIPKIFPVL